MREAASGIALVGINAIVSNNEGLWWPQRTANNGITPPQFILLRGKGTQQSTIDVLSG
jgi:hypothetical protein